MKKGIVIVSFGTTYPGTRHKNIERITEQVRSIYPDVVIEEAVSSRTVRRIMKEREEIHALDTGEALEALMKQGVTDAVVFATHMIDGIEYHRVAEEAGKYKKDFEVLKIAKALLTEDKDYCAVAKAFWESVKNEVQSMPLILMGHGTEHAADASYQKMEQILREYSNHAVYIATVEGRVTIDDVIGRMKVDKCVESGGEVMVMPFMLVAGEHANHDMAGEEGSFSSKLKEAGYQPKCMIRGIGEYAAVRDIYMEHLRRMTKDLFLGSRQEDKTGTLYGIGVGPGNPKLITLEALETIRSCNVILLPAVSKEECYAYRIVRQVYPEIADKPLLCMPFPMIHDKQKLELAHERAYDAVKDYLDLGQTVGMLTIGDPGIYSTYLYMHKRALKDGKKAQIINGVPSFCAVAARLGIGLGGKAQEIRVIPASYDIADALQYHGVCIYMKSGKKLKQLVEALKEQVMAERKYEIYAVSDCGMETERVYHGLEEVAEAGGYLTTVIVKENA